MDGGPDSFQSIKRNYLCRTASFNGYPGSILEQAAKNCFIMLARLTVGVPPNASLHQKTRGQSPNAGVLGISGVKKWPPTTGKWMSNTFELSIVGHHQQRQMSEITAGEAESIFLLSFNRRQLLASVWGTSHHTAGRRKTKLPWLQSRNIDAPVPLRDRRARPQIMQIAFVSECSQEHQRDIWRDVNNNKLETVFDQNKSGLCAGLNGSPCYSNRFINHNWNFSRTWEYKRFHHGYRQTANGPRPLLYHQTINVNADVHGCFFRLVTKVISDLVEDKFILSGH